MDEILKMIIRREKIYLSPENGILVQRKIVEILTKKENDLKTIRCVVKFYRALILQNNGN